MSFGLWQNEKQSESSNMLSMKLHDKRHGAPVLGLMLLILGLLPSLAAAQEAAPSREVYLLSQTFVVAKPPTLEAQFSLDGQSLVTLSGNHRLEFWVPQSAKRLRVLPTGEHRATLFVQHPTQPLLLTGGEDDTLRIWDLERSMETGILRGHLAAISGMVLDPTATTAVSGSEDGTLIYWDLTERKLIKQVPQAHRGAIKALAFHPGGEMMASGGADGMIHLWKLPDLTLIKTLEGHLGEVTEVQFTPLGEKLISSSADQTLKFWDWNTGTIEKSITHHRKAVTSFDLHPDVGRLVSSSADGGVAVWSFPEGEHIFDLKSVAGPVSRIHFDSSGKRLIAALTEGQVQTWELGTSSFLASLSGHERPVDALAFSRNGKYLATASSDKTIRLWEMDTKQMVRQYATENHRVQSMSFSPDSKYLYTGGADSTIRIWNAQDGNQEVRLAAHKGKVNALAFHPNGQILLTGGSDHQWMLWNLETNDNYRVQKSHRDQVTAVDFSPDGSLFVTASNDRTAQIWSFPKGEPLGVLRGHSRGLTDVAFSPTDPLIATASQDGTLRLWDITDPEEPVLRLILEGHSYIISRLFFSNNGKALISISRDKTVRLWSTANGQMIRILNGESTALTNGALSPDGNLIAVTNLANTVSLLAYPVDIPELKALENLPVVTAEAPASPAGAAAPAAALDPITLTDPVRNLSDLTATSTKMTPEELQVYAVPVVPPPSTRGEELQQELNQILAGQVCQGLDRLEQVAMELLTYYPDEMAAYHGLLKTALLREDLALAQLLVYVGSEARFRPNTFSYATELTVRNAFGAWKDSVFDQTSPRQGKPMEFRLRNCRGQERVLTLPEGLQTLRVPQEFIQKLTRVARIVDFRDFRNLPLEEFLNRFHHEVDRVLQTDQPLPVSRRPRPLSQPVEAVETGLLNLNLEQTASWKNGGNVPFRLRRSGLPWQSYVTDRDNRLLLQLPVGNYSLQVGTTISSAFRVTSGQTTVPTFK